MNSPPSESYNEQTYPLFGVNTRPLFSFHPVRKKNVWQRWDNLSLAPSCSALLYISVSLVHIKCLTCACWGWSQPLQPHSAGWPYGPATTLHLRSPTRAARLQTWTQVLDWESHSRQFYHSQKEPWKEKEDFNEAFHKKPLNIYFLKSHWYSKNCAFSIF